MKKTAFLGIIFFVLIFASCLSVPTEKNRDLTLSGYAVNEQEYGGCERWYVIEKNGKSKGKKILFQVGYFKEKNAGFILFGDGKVGELAQFARNGIDLRWDWGTDERLGSYKYSFVIKPDGTGLYYDFSKTGKGTVKPKGMYQTKKF